MALFETNAQGTQPTDPASPQELLRRLVRIEAKLDKLTGGASSVPRIEAADDRELDGKFGDPVVGRDPKDWKGQSCVGMKYSACPPEFLDKLGNLLAWKSSKNAEDGKDKYAKFDALDCARARGWAIRNKDKFATRAVYVRAAAPQEQKTLDPFEDDMGF